MSKITSVSEGSVQRIFGPVAKLITMLQTSGTCEWVPEDEVQLQTIHATKNGTYTPSDNYYGIGAVETDVTYSGFGGSAHIDLETGTPELQIGEGTTWTFDEEGTPTLEGIEGFDFDEIGLDEGTDYTLTFDEEGSPTVIGTKDGEKITATVDAQTGETTIKNAPSAIEIELPPEKLEYLDGEKIDFQGIRVVLKNADGSTFTDSRYPHGVVPMSELSFPVVIAQYTQGVPYKLAPEGFTIGDFNNPLSFNLGGAQRWSSNYIVDFFDCIIFAYTSRYGLLVLEGDHDIIEYDEYYRNMETMYHKYMNANKYTYDGKTVSFFVWVNNNPVSWDDDIIIHSEDSMNGSQLDKPRSIAWSLVYGDPVEVASQITIPVRWYSHYDGKACEDTFEILVHAEEHQGDDDGGYTTEYPFGDPTQIPDGVTVHDIQSAISSAMQAGSDICVIAGYSYTISQANFMLEMLMNRDIPI